MKKLISVMALSLSVLFLLTACNTGKDNYVMLIDNVPVGVPEYKYYLHLQKEIFEEDEGERIWNAEFDGSSAEDSAKKRAYESISLIKLSVSEAKRQGLTLNESEKAIARKDTDDVVANMGAEKLKKIGLTEDELLTIMEEAQLYYKLYDKTTSRFQVDYENNPEFNEYYRNFEKKNYDKLKEVYAKYILFKTWGKDETEKSEIEREANDCLRHIEMGASFDLSVEAYSGGEKKFDEPAFISKEEFGEDIFQEVYSLSEGELSKVLRGEKGLYIFLVMKVVTLPSDDIIKEVKEEFLHSQREQFFQSQYDRWKDDVQFEINKTVWDNISINDV